MCGSRAVGNVATAEHGFSSVANRERPLVTGGPEFTLDCDVSFVKTPEDLRIRRARYSVLQRLLLFWWRDGQGNRPLNGLARIGWEFVTMAASRRNEQSAPNLPSQHSIPQRARPHKTVRGGAQPCADRYEQVDTIGDLCRSGSASTNSRRLKPYEVTAYSRRSRASSINRSSVWPRLTTWSPHRSPSTSREVQAALERRTGFAGLSEFVRV